MNIQAEEEEEEVSDFIQFRREWLELPRWMQLAPMALCIHSILAISAEVGWVFSSSKILISNHRNKLGNKVISTVTCLKSWENVGLVRIEKVQEVEESLHTLEERKVSGIS
jgi:hypothetical protein